jgi:hypothetical protein
MFTLTTLFWMVVALYVVRWVFAASRGSPAISPAAQAEVARLRAEVDELSATVRRLAEEQSFMVRLLSDGERRALPPAGGDAPETPPDSQPEET